MNQAGAAASIQLNTWLGWLRAEHSPGAQPFVWGLAVSFLPCLCLLLVHPRGRVVVPLADALREPQRDLLVGAVDAVAAMADVAADVNAEVAADRAGRAVERLGLAEHLAAGEDGVLALPHHAADRARQDVLDEAAEERLAREVGVVRLDVLLGRARELERDELEALGLEAGDDLADLGW